MPIILFKHSEKTTEVPAGTLLLDAIKNAGISIDAPCGGYGVCGKCLVKVESGQVDFENNGVVPQVLLDEGFVLACKAKMKDESIEINVNLKKDKELGKFMQMFEGMHLIDNSLLPKQADIDPIVKKASIFVKEAQMGDGLSDFDRLRNAVIESLSVKDIELPISILKVLPDLVREENGNVNISYYIQYEVAYIVNMELESSREHYGVAVDIGTTTVAVQLVVMKNGLQLDAKTEYNGQIECGLDIISRINYANKPERLADLRRKVLDTVNGIIKELVEQNGLHPTDIVNASIAANPTMVQLFMGIIPEYVRLSPYTPTLYAAPLYSAADLGLKVHPRAPVYIAPSVGSYVGGDITSGMLCSSLATDSDELCLFIDIGTNGEIVIGNNEFLMGCACSAGPAFEGGGLKCGMRASMGAVERLEIDPETGEPTCFTIGNLPPVGICGSGIISFMAQMLKTGWLDPAGRFDRSRPCKNMDFSEKNGKYYIALDGESGSGKDVFITEVDIDNVMRAKAAIFSACATIMKSIEMGFSALSHIYVAGGFGRFLDVDNCQAIGLLPNLPKECFSFIGNSSILGAYMTLLSRKHRELENELAQKITYVDLGSEPGYMDQYTAALFLPHTDASLFS